MYLMPVGTSARSTTKWGLGGLAGFGSRDAHGWGLGMHRQRRFSRRRDLGYLTKKGSLGLGDDCPAGSYQNYSTQTGLPECVPGVDYPVPGIAPAPSQPGVNPSIDAAYKNLLTQQQASQDPLDYVSPQAAIAAGLNPQIVYAAWSKAMAKFPTSNAAVQAGVPAGVVTQLWAASRTAAPATSWLDQAPLGVANKLLLMGGAGIFLLTALRGHGRR